MLIGPLMLLKAGKCGLLDSLVKPRWWDFHCIIVVQYLLLHYLGEVSTGLVLHVSNGKVLLDACNRYIRAIARYQCMLRTITLLFDYLLSRQFRASNKAELLAPDKGGLCTLHLASCSLLALCSHFVVANAHC